MTPLVTKIDARSGAARATTVQTPRGAIVTPAFMPVGTRGAVKTLDADDLREIGPQVVLGNTYHLMMRPGADLVSELGGLHKFSGWGGHMLTDSGGFQVFSLGPDVDDDGVTFRSTYDGSRHRFTPERAMRVQELLGADIAMTLDVCPPLPSSAEVVELAMRRTHDWAARCREAHNYDQQALFGIVQGGTDPALREGSAKEITELEFDGYGIGGLSVGEPREEMLPALEATVRHLPEDRLRYLMGVGDPLNLIDGVERGVDLFDCVLPTRLARHGTVLSSVGRYQLKNAVNAADLAPLDPACSCRVCAGWSKGYLRHLFQVGEPTGQRLVTIHNLSFLVGLVGRLRQALLDGDFPEVAEELRAPWVGR